MAIFGCEAKDRNPVTPNMYVFYKNKTEQRHFSYAWRHFGKKMAIFGCEAKDRNPVTPNMYDQAYGTSKGGKAKERPSTQPASQLSMAQRKE